MDTLTPEMTGLLGAVSAARSVLPAVCSEPGCRYGACPAAHSAAF